MLKYFRERLKRDYTPKELMIRTQVSKAVSLFSAVLPLFQPNQLFLSAVGTIGGLLFYRRYKKRLDETKVGKGEVICTLGKDELGREVGIDKFHFFRHVLVVGGTGMGKTSLYRVMIRQLLEKNFGLIYVNFKAEDEDFLNLYFICKELGVEKNLLILNFSPSAKETLETHTFSPLATLKTPQEIADFFFYLLPPAKGEMEYWQGRGRFLMNASARNFCYLRDVKGKRATFELFLKAFDLHSILTAYTSPDCPEEYKKYFETYLQDLDPTGEVRKRGSLRGIPPDLQVQHGYALQQWKETFSDISLRYSHIFDTDKPDIDMIDVIKRNRILYIHMPALTIPDKTRQGLGRLILASIRVAVKTLLGETLTGEYEEIKKAKKLEKPKNPFAIIVDEHGTAPIQGIDDFMRQLRSLGGGIVIADQNWDTLKEEYGEGYLNSILANAHTKIFMKVEGSKVVMDYLRERIPRVRKMFPDFRKREVLVEEDERRTLQEDYLRRPEEVYELSVGEGIIVQGNNFLKVKFDYYEPKKEGKVELFSYNRSVINYSKEIIKLLEKDFSPPKEEEVVREKDFDEDELFRPAFAEEAKIYAKTRDLESLRKILNSETFNNLPEEEKVKLGREILKALGIEEPGDKNEILKFLDKIKKNQYIIS